MEKTCTKCHTTKSITEFYKCKGGKFGVKGKCKVCCGEERKQWTEDNREWNNERARQYRKTQKNTIYESGYRKKYTSTFNGTVTRLLNGAKKRAQESNAVATLDREWVIAHLTPMICEASGVGLSLYKAAGVHHNSFRPSIDRVDNDKGYTKDNCRITSVMYNRMKNDGDDTLVMVMITSLLKKEGLL